MNKKEKSKNFDKIDILSHFKSRFYNPENLIYLDGNSLGKLPIGTKKVVNKIIDEQWGENLIRSWNDHWLELPKKMSSKIAQLINAEKNEVIVGDSTSVNLFKLACALINSKIFPKQLITDTLNFPTDNYILDGICKQYSLSNLKSIQYSNDIEAEIPLLKETIKNFPGILCLSLVTYKSSYLYPIKELNDYANKNNSIIIWDLSHAIGVVDIDIRETNTLLSLIHI